jgi:hypothetical protein
VFLWALAATALAGPATLWSPWPRGLLEDSTITSSEFAAFTTIVFVLPIFLLPLGAYLSDRAAILGSRREGYLVLGSLLTAITWAAAPFVPRAFGPWLVIGVGLYTANALTRVAVEGGLAEIGQRRRSTGRLGAAALGLGSAAGLAAYPLLDRLLQRPLGWTAAVGAIAGLSVAVIALRALQTIAPAEVAPPPAARVGPWLRSRAFGTGLLVLAGGAFPQAAEKLLDAYQGLNLKEAQDLHLRADIAASVAAILGAAAYYIACTRIRLRRLLPVALLIEAASLLTLLGLQGTTGGVVLARIAFALGWTFAGCARFDLVLRLAPPGREAFGLALLTGAAHLFTSMVSSVSMAVSAPLEGDATFLVVGLAAGAGLWALATLAVPRGVLDARDHPP